VGQLLHCVKQFLVLITLTLLLCTMLLKLLKCKICRVLVATSRYALRNLVPKRFIASSVQQQCILSLLTVPVHGLLTAVICVSTVR